MNQTTRFYGGAPAAPSSAPASMPAPPPAITRIPGGIASPASITNNPLGYKTNTGAYVTHQPWSIGVPQPLPLSPWSPAVRR